MREHEFITQRDQAILLKLLADSYRENHDTQFVENDENFNKIREVIDLYKVIGVAVTDIAKILSK